MKRTRKADASSSKEESSADNLPVHGGAKRLFNLQRGKRHPTAQHPKDKDKANEKSSFTLDISRGELHRRVQSFKHPADLRPEQLRAWIESLLSGLNIFIFGIGDKLPLLRAFARCMDRSDVFLVERGGSVRDLFDALVSHPLKKTLSDMRCKDLSLFSYADEVLRTLLTNSMNRCC